MNIKRSILLAITLGLATGMSISAQPGPEIQESTLIQKLANVPGESLFCAALNAFPAYAVLSLYGGSTFSAELIAKGLGVTTAAVLAAFAAQYAAQQIA